MISRKKFIKLVGTATGTLLLPWRQSMQFKPTNKILRFGLCADPHHDIIPDGKERLQKFVSKAQAEQVDFILQLGDFCFPKIENRSFLKIWQQFDGARYHVLGNHDMDISSKEETMDFWGMPNKYYAFDRGGYHFIVLDANYIRKDGIYQDYKHANFYIDSSQRTFINEEQIRWLQEDLANTSLPTIIFSHQSLVNTQSGIKNRLEIQQILEESNRKAGYQKVIACFNGHDHIDFSRTLNQIHYVEINSMSYHWVGAEYEDESRYPKSYYQKRPNLGKVAPYQDSLYAIVTIDPAGYILIEGVRSEWVNPSPQKLGVPENVKGNRLSPVISDYKLQI